MKFKISGVTTLKYLKMLNIDDMIEVHIPTLSDKAVDRTSHTVHKVYHSTNDFTDAIKDLNLRVKVLNKPKHERIIESTEEIEEQMMCNFFTLKSDIVLLIINGLNPLEFNSIKHIFTMAKLLCKHIIIYDMKHSRYYSSIQGKPLLPMNVHALDMSPLESISFKISYGATHMPIEVLNNILTDLKIQLK